MNWYLALTLATAGTYAVRAASVRAFGSRGLPARVQRALELAALAILAALSVSSIPVNQGGPFPSVATATAVVAAIAAARRVGNVGLIIVIAIATHTMVDAVAR